MATALQKTTSTPQDIDLGIIELLAECERDPLGFVTACFPWGEPDTPLEHETIENWQRDVLVAVRDGLLTLDQAIQIAVASGHGIGKSALVAWLILWGISTFEDAKGVVTANTETQLKTKTWAELGKWYRLFIGRRFFRLTATALFSVDPRHERTWRIDMVPWSERNVEAFAGLHNQGKRVLLIFDEASAIPDTIWETSQGALTDRDTQILWLAFGNPTRNTGRFKECFARFRHRWDTRQIDSRSVGITNKKELDGWVEDYGEDSDYVRVRVRGVFPRASWNQFISTELVEAAAERFEATVSDEASPLIFGVDVARFGDDQSVLLARQGRKVPWLKEWRGQDNHALALLIAEQIDRHKPEAVFIDAGGGAGVIDTLKSLKYTVIEVAFGSRKTLNKPTKYFNKRAEMYGDARDWLAVGAIPRDQQLIDDLTGPEYGFAGEQLIQLERKEHMKARGLASPDKGDALVLTFAQTVLHSKTNQMVRSRQRRRRAYNPLDFRPQG